MFCLREIIACETVQSQTLPDDVPGFWEPFGSCATLPDQADRPQEQGCNNMFLLAHPLHKCNSSEDGHQVKNTDIIFIVVSLWCSEALVFRSRVSIRTSPSLHLHLGP